MVAVAESRLVAVMAVRDNEALGAQSLLDRRQQAGVVGGPELREVALLAGEPDIRQVIAFPKVASGSDPLTGAPTPLPETTLRDLGIRSIVPVDQA